MVSPASKWERTVIPHVSWLPGRGHTGRHLRVQTRVSNQSNNSFETIHARLRLFERTALEVEGGVYLHEFGPELGVAFGEPKEKT